MPKAEVHGDVIIVETEFHEKELIRSVPGSRWDANLGRWTVRRAWSSCIMLRGVFGDSLQLGPQLTAWATELRKNFIEPSMAWREQLDAPGDPRLYPFQRAGSTWMALTQEAILADEMGTGKTIQTIDALKKVDDPFPALIIAPNGVKAKWKREIEKWWPGLEVVVVRGGAVARRKALSTPAHVYIIHWEAVRLHSRLAPYGSYALKRCRACGGEETVQEGSCEVHLRELNTMGFHTVVADEAHRLFSPSSKWTRAVWAVAHGPSVRYRWPLTGTPLANDPSDTWSLLHFCDPDEFPSKSKYVDRYCLKSWNAWGGLEVIGVRPDTREEFFQIFDPRFRRMPKELVLPFLPPKVRDVRYADMTPAQEKAYSDMDGQLITRLEDGKILYATNSLTANTRLMQFASSSAIIDDDGKVRLAEPSSKLDQLEEVLQELGWKWATKKNPAHEGEPVVVFAESRQLLVLAQKRLEKHGVRHWLLAGGMSDDLRDNYVQDFASGPPGIMLVVIKAGGEGIDLIRAKYAIFLQRSWSMLGNKQAEDRVHRIGSEVHDSVELIDIVAPGTVEEGQVERIHEKFRRLEEINRDKQRVQNAAELAALEQEETSIMMSDVAVPQAKKEEG